MVETKEQFAALLQEMAGYKTDWMYDVAGNRYIIAFYGKDPAKRVVVSGLLASEVRGLNK